MHIYLKLKNTVGYSRFFSLLIFPQEQRKEVVELRRSLQQSQVESQVLRGELRKACGQSAPPAHFMEEKIQLLKEVSPTSSAHS